MSIESKIERMISRAYAAFDSDDFLFAARLCRRVMAEWRTGEEQLRWEAAILLAESLEARGQLDASLMVACEVGCNGEKQAARGRALVGHILVRWGMREAAEGAYRAALAASPSESRFLHCLFIANVISSFWGLPRLAEAERMALEASDLRADWDEAYNILGRIYFADGRYLAAERAISQAKRLDPQDVRYREFYARIIARSPAALSRALNLLSSLRREIGERWWLLADLGLVQWMLGRKCAATTSLAKAVSIAPVTEVGAAVGVEGVLGVSALYADVTLQSGAIDDAVRILDESADFSQEIAHWWVVRGEARARLGEVAEGQGCFEKAKALLETELQYAQMDYVRLQLLGRALKGLEEHAARSIVEAKVDAILRELSECAEENS